MSLLALVSVFSLLLPQDSNQGGDTQDNLDALVHRLGDRDPDCRDRAMEILETMGLRIQAKLREALSHDDIEIRTNVRRVLGRIETGYRVVSRIRPHPYPFPERSARAASFSPDGKEVVLARSGGKVYVVDLVEGVITRLLDGLGWQASAVDFSPDGRHVLGANSEGQLRLWDLKASGTGKDLTLAGGYIKQASFSPDGRHILTIEDKGKIRIRDGASGRLIKELKASRRGAHSATYCPDGKHILAGSADGQIILWDAATGRNVYRRPSSGGDSLAVAVSPGGKVAAAGGRNERIELFALHTGTRLREISARKGRIRSVSFSPDGMRLVSTARRDRAFRIWDVAEGQKLKRVPANQDLAGAYFTPDGKHILAHGSSYGAQLWDLGHETRISESDIEWLRALSPDLKLAASWSKEGFKVWDLGTGKTVSNVTVTDKALIFGFTPDGKGLVLGNSRSVWIQELGSGKVVERWKPRDDEPSWRAAFSPSGKRIVLSDSWAHVELFDRNRKRIQMWDMGTGFINSMHDNGTPERLFISHDDQKVVMVRDKVHIFDAASGKETLQFPRHYRDLVHAITPDGKYVVLSTFEGILRLVDTKRGKVFREFKGHHGRVEAFQFSPDGGTFYAAGKREITVWRRR